MIRNHCESVILVMHIYENVMDWRKLESYVSGCDYNLQLFKCISLLNLMVEKGLMPLFLALKSTEHVHTKTFYLTENLAILSKTANNKDPPLTKR